MCEEGTRRVHRNALFPDPSGFFWLRTHSFKTCVLLNVISFMQFFHQKNSHFFHQNHSFCFLMTRSEVFYSLLSENKLIQLNLSISFFCLYIFSKNKYYIQSRTLFASNWNIKWVTSVTGSLKRLFSNNLSVLTMNTKMFLLCMRT